MPKAFELPMRHFSSIYLYVVYLKRPITYFSFGKLLLPSNFFASTLLRKSTKHVYTCQYLSGTACFVLLSLRGWEFSNILHNTMNHVKFPATLSNTYQTRKFLCNRRLPWPASILGAELTGCHVSILLADVLAILR